MRLPNMDRGAEGFKQVSSNCFCAVSKVVVQALDGGMKTVLRLTRDLPVGEKRCEAAEDAWSRSINLTGQSDTSRG